MSRWLKRSLVWGRTWNRVRPAGVVLERGVLDEASSLIDRFALSWSDALIVAAARVAECAFLLSEDMQDGQDFGGLTVVDPFAHSPDDFFSG